MNKTCDRCNEQAMFFHSRCCNAHLEGVILPDGNWIVVCENCGKYCGHLHEEKDFSGKKFWLGK